MFRRRRRPEIDAKDKSEPGATWKEFERERKATNPAKLLRLSLPILLGGVAGAFTYTGVAAAWGFAMGAVIGATMVFIVRQIDVERPHVAVAASVVGSVTGAPPAAFLSIALILSAAPGWSAGVVPESFLLIALACGFAGWIVGTLAGGFAAVVVWGFMEFFG